MADSPASRPRGWSLVDAGAAVAVLLAAAGVIWSPKLSSAVAKATGDLRPVKVMVDVRGVPVADPGALISAIETERKVAIVIRNQPHGTVAIQKLIPLQSRLVALQPNGSVVTAIDPNQAVFGRFDARFVLEGQGRRSEGGVVFGNQSLKIGAPVELEGKQYRVQGVVTDLQVGEG
ncbi:DUF4330 domain-containing protein [Synechococcus sp. CBW1006]|uniref:DUF4330 domain-containing protein n=1 Tax=Synechococcus sp. CBW1006 TaxID=1353138 RepID=UPI0018CF8A40|nr:DUF4330 domain-containing protein [Synechococcus sp. CBW1006]QPN66363.1 DUF4330 domain-containing protein [Synechococcus sp. CBW1006]